MPYQGVADIWASGYHYQLILLLLDARPAPFHIAWLILAWRLTSGRSQTMTYYFFFFIEALI